MNGDIWKTQAGGVGGDMNKSIPFVAGLVMWLVSGALIDNGHGGLSMACAACGFVLIFGAAA